MSEEILKPLSAAELAEIDARYEPFPSFSDWPNEVPNTDLWDDSREAFQAAADDATDADLRRALEIAQRAAAFDTGAIEGLYPTSRGLTFTVAEQAAFWEQEVDAQSADARALFEAQLHAFELVLDHVTDRFPTMTQVWLRRLHEEITAPQEMYPVRTPVGVQMQPLPRGRYKEHPNHVRTADGKIHAYAPVESTPSEMQRLTIELETPVFRDAHPILQASYAHYALVAVHPFADGNGRVARAAASVYTYRAASIPLLVLNDLRDEYFAALATADAGNAVPFVGFIMRVACDALALVSDSLRTARAPQPDSVLNRFEGLLRGKHHDGLDRAAIAFVDWLSEAARRQVAALEIPEGIEIDVETFEDSLDPPPNFRSILAPGLKGVRLNFKSLPPAEEQVLRRIDVFVSARPDSTVGLLARAVEPPNESMTLNRSDLQPLSNIAQLRVENFLQRLMGEGLENLRKRASRRLRGADEPER